jgi:1,4-dihydroxy-2-naphthoyl-CoA synthase
LRKRKRFHGHHAGTAGKSPARQTKPVVVWATLGALLLAFEAWVIIRWVDGQPGDAVADLIRDVPWAAPLPLMIPRRVAMELLLTGVPLSAARAYQIGFVNLVAEPDDLIGAVQSLGEQIAANAPLSVSAGKQTAALTAEYFLSESFDRAESIWAPVYLSADAQEGMQAFKDKRAPHWKGS